MNMNHDQYVQMFDIDLTFFAIVVFFVFNANNYFYL